MKRLLLGFFACAAFLSPLFSCAQEEIVPDLGDDTSVETSIPSVSSEDGGLFLARVEQILEEGESKDFEYTEKFQRIIIRFITGPDKNTTVEITNGGVVSVGDTVVLREEMWWSLIKSIQLVVIPRII